MIRKNLVTGLTATALLSGIGIFLKRVYMADRLMEFFISTITVIGIYYLLYVIDFSLSWVLAVPLAVYIIIWGYLLSHEKISSLKANPAWADRSWWWKLDGWEFEEEVAKVFRLNGYRARVTRKTGDDGVDVIMYKDKDKIIVQCKHYVNPVGVSVARELNGIKDDFKATKLILVASSGVTQPCQDFIRNKPYFKILNLEDIIRLGLRPRNYSS